MRVFSVLSELEFVIYACDILFTLVVRKGQSWGAFEKLLRNSG